MCLHHHHPFKISCHDLMKSTQTHIKYLWNQYGRCLDSYFWQWCSSTFHPSVKLSTRILIWELGWLSTVIKPGVQKSGHQVTVVTKICTVVPNICGLLVGNMPHATLLAPGNFEVAPRKFGKFVCPWMKLQIEWMENWGSIQSGGWMFCTLPPFPESRANPAPQ